MEFRILSINPGATSTKISVYDDETPLFEETIRHDVEILRQFEKTSDQFKLRADTIAKTLAEKGVDISSLSALSGVAEPSNPCFGTYRVNDSMKDDVRNGNVSADHISNIGCLLADEIAGRVKLPAFIVDPVSVMNLLMRQG